MRLPGGCFATKLIESAAEADSLPSEWGNRLHIAADGGSFRYHRHCRRKRGKAFGGPRPGGNQRQSIPSVAPAGYHAAGAAEQNQSRSDQTQIGGHPEMAVAEDKCSCPAAGRLKPAAGSTSTHPHKFVLSAWRPKIPVTASSLNVEFPSAEFLRRTSMRTNHQLWRSALQICRNYGRRV